MVWRSRQDRDSSLSLRQVQDAIPRARPLVANFERVAVITPVWRAEFDRARPTDLFPCSLVPCSLLP